MYDSTKEREFAKLLDTDTSVAVYVKLPDGFYISTPVGIEKEKIHCAEEHFKAINNSFADRDEKVVYRMIDSYQELLEMVRK